MCIRDRDEAQHVARVLFDEIGVGRLGGEQRHVALEPGAHGLEPSDLELQPCRAGDQSGSGLEAVSAIKCMIGERAGESEAGKHN
jgi:hypothetical protein